MCVVESLIGTFDTLAERTDEAGKNSAIESVRYSASAGVTFASARRMHDPISRRQFVIRAAAIPGVSHAVFGRLTLSSDVRVGVTNLQSPPVSARDMGLTLGAEEATHAALLFGGSFTLTSASPSQGLTAVIGDTRCSGAMPAGVPFFNVGCAGDSLHGAACTPNVFHIAPSEAMRRDALTLSRRSGNVSAWHPTLVRFGADTLNRRFLVRFGKPMTADAWTAWLATKIIWESVLRLRAADPAPLTAHLTDDAAHFDGHKGLPLSFRKWDHQLRQPLYVVSEAGVTEVPVATRPGEPARDVLDRLGAGPARPACRT